jgi:hypothetical protein
MPDPWDPSAADSARTLLEAPAVDDGPGCASDPSTWDRLVVSLFVAYHALVLVAYNTPAAGPTQDLHRVFNRHAQMYAYMQLTGSRQSWGMFAPSPPNVNIFMRVLVEDQSGRPRDLGHDAYGRRRFPSLAYDVNVKLNERLADEPAYREPYAAWVCREWERAHGGTPARRVRFVQVSTRIPPPREAYRTMGYHPMGLDPDEVEVAAYECATLPHGQLPDALRRRFGLPLAAPGTFREIDGRTWRTPGRDGTGPPRWPRPAPEGR